MKINCQPIEKQNLDVNGALSLHSIFYTIQGEGPFTGKPAIFVRLAGCNLQCPGCDTNYTTGRINVSYNHLLEMIRREHSHVSFKPLIVITGGEPFRQNIAPLVRTLSSCGYRVQIETNGTLYVEDMPWDSITVICSPKAGKINPLLRPHIDAYKYVLSADSVDPDDGLPTLALGHSASPQVARPLPGNTKPIYLQPMDPNDVPRDHLSSIKFRENLEACIHSCMRFGYILQLQTHKIIGLE